MNKSTQHYLRRFFGYMMQLLKQDGFARSKRKKMIRDSGLVEICKTENGVDCVLYYDIRDWYKYVVNPNTWMGKVLVTDKRFSMTEKHINSQHLANLHKSGIFTYVNF